MINEEDIIVGALVKHSLYGTGYVMAENLTGCDIIFERGGKISFSKRNVLDDLELLKEPPLSDRKPRITLDEVTDVLRSLLECGDAIEEKIILGDRWTGGKLILQPVGGTQSKEMPIETFFHKIVMVRDRLRVLEQNINSNKNLTDEQKVDMQQYITRIYGSLTSFNILFKNKEDYFVGTGAAGDKD
jgi:hypothetical protein